MRRFIDKIVGEFGAKRRWREYKERVKALPEDYRSTVEALERYVMYSGAITNGDVLMSMLEDLADLLEQAAADGTPSGVVVGDDPVQFADTLLRNYPDGYWINKERDRLVKAVKRAGTEHGRTRS